ncbi:hypothetical protein F7U66_01420 [Vibrio parahaemolyticus]|nr:hypothetical protein [Vibrio parahaemolyticus]
MKKSSVGVRGYMGLDTFMRLAKELFDTEPENIKVMELNLEDAEYDDFVLEQDRCANENNK